MDSIKTIEQLVEVFEEADLTKQGRILQNLEIPSTEFEEHATWSRGSYTRNCITRRNDFELILLCWDAESKTKIHDHAGQHCWVYQVEGEVREVRLNGPAEDLKSYSDEVLEEGDLSYMHDKMGYHFIQNEQHKRAMTLHVYARPIDSCKVYNDESAEFETVDMEYDSICDRVSA